MAAWTQALQRRDTGRDRHRGGADPDRLPRIGTVAALVRGGQLSLIEVTTEKRLPQFSDVPTVSESGSPGFFFNSWFALWRLSGRRRKLSPG